MSIPIETGVISEGTLNHRDLFYAFLYTLETYEPTTDVDAWIRDFVNEDAGEVVDSLSDRLSELAAEQGLWFGTLEGDGACFGIWKNEEDEDDV